MRKHLLSFDKFHEQKSLEYVKLFNQAVSNRSKTSAKNRLLYRKCPTQGHDDINKMDRQAQKGQTRFLSTFLSITQKTSQPRKSVNPSYLERRIDRNSDNNMRLAMNPEYQENLFENDYLRQRLKMARIHQCKVKDIIFGDSQNFESLECLNNSKAFKIRSRKFQFFGELVKSKRRNSDLELVIKNPQDLEIAEAYKRVQL